MKPITYITKREFEEVLRKRFEERGRTRYDGFVGLVFAREGNEFVKKHLTPCRMDFHVRSGDHVDFFWVGWEHIRLDGPGIMDGNIWNFHSERFESSRHHFEAETSWRFGGGTELVLIAVSYKLNERAPILSLNQAIVCDLEKMVADKTILSVGHFFESIFRHCEDNTSAESLKQFSDKLGAKIAGKSFLHYLISLLSKDLSYTAQQLMNLAIRDVSKNT